MKDTLKKAGIVAGGVAIMATSLAANTAECNYVSSFKSNEHLNLFIKESRDIIKENGGSMKFENLDCTQEVAHQMRQKIEKRQKNGTLKNEKLKDVKKNVKTDSFLKLK